MVDTVQLVIVMQECSTHNCHDPHGLSRYKLHALLRVTLDVGKTNLNRPSENESMVPNIL